MHYHMVHFLVFWACLPATAFAVVVRDSPQSQDEILGKGQTVILGTWNWKIEGNQFGHKTEADFWWEQVDQKTRFLVSRGGAGWALFKGRSFESLTREDLARASYTTAKLPGTQLVRDAVVAVRTRDGKFAKLKVVGYRELHDVSFPEAKHLSPAWVQFTRQRPNVKEYHLEVLWVLYKAR